MNTYNPYALFEQDQKAKLARRVRRRRKLLREAGLRPVQLWIADTRQPGFAAECRRQCLAIRAAEPASKPAAGRAAMPAASRRRRQHVSISRGDVVMLEVPRRAPVQGHARPQGHVPVQGHARPQARAERALVIQADAFEAHSQLAVLPLSRDGVPVPAPLLRITLPPGQRIPPLAPAQIIVDHIQTIPRRAVRAVIGQLDRGTLRAVERALALFLGIAR